MVALLVLSAASVAGFVRRSLKGSHPVADLRLFRERNFLVGCIMSFALGVGRLAGRVPGTTRASSKSRCAFLRKAVNPFVSRFAADVVTFAQVGQGQGASLIIAEKLGFEFHG